jgi:hypothetical protein
LTGVSQQNICFSVALNFYMGGCGTQLNNIKVVWETTIPVGSQHRGSAWLNLEKHWLIHMAFWCALDHLEVFHFPSVISYSIPPLSRLIVLLPTVLSVYLIMTFSLSKFGSAKQLSDIPQPHVFETFRFSEDYEAFRRQVILPSIHDSHDHQYIYYSDKPALPLPVSFAPSRPSIKSVYRLILDTDINSSKFRYQQDIN